MTENRLFGLFFGIGGSLLLLLHAWDTPSLSLNGVIFVLTGLVYGYQERLVQACRSHQAIYALMWFLLAIGWLFYLLYDTATISIGWLGEQEVFLSFLALNLSLSQIEKKVKQTD